MRSIFTLIQIDKKALYFLLNTSLVSYPIILFEQIISFFFYEYLIQFKFFYVSSQNKLKQKNGYSDKCNYE